MLLAYSDGQIVLTMLHTTLPTPSLPIPVAVSALATHSVRPPHGRGRASAGSAGGSIPLAQSDILQQTQETTGLYFDSSELVNQATLSRINFVGDCPGISRSWLRAQFRSATIPPSPGMRVRLTNLSASGGEAPFTDREYDKGNLSEKTHVTLGGAHENKYFAVVPGLNKISYKIYSSSSAVETGSFTVNIVANESRQIRQAGITSERVCASFASLSLDQCADVRIKQIIACPDGRILSSTLQPDSQLVRTSIRNETAAQQSFIYNGAPIMLFPGQEFAFLSPKYSTQQVTYGGYGFNLTIGKKHRITTGYSGSVSIY